MERSKKMLMLLLVATAALQMSNQVNGAAGPTKKEQAEVERILTGFKSKKSTAEKKALTNQILRLNPQAVLLNPEATKEFGAILGLSQQSQPRVTAYKENLARTKKNMEKMEATEAEMEVAQAQVEESEKVIQLTPLIFESHKIMDGIQMRFVGQINQDNLVEAEKAMGTLVDAMFTLQSHYNSLSASERQKLEGNVIGQAYNETLESGAKLTTTINEEITTISEEIATSKLLSLGAALGEVQGKIIEIDELLAIGVTIANTEEAKKMLMELEKLDMHVSSLIKFNTDAEKQRFEKSNLPQEYAKIKKEAADKYRELNTAIANIPAPIFQTEEMRAQAVAATTRVNHAIVALKEAIADIQNVAPKQLDIIITEAKEAAAEARAAATAAEGAGFNDAAIRARQAAESANVTVVEAQEAVATRDEAKRLQLVDAQAEQNAIKKVKKQQVAEQEAARIAKLPTDEAVAERQALELARFQENERIRRETEVTAQVKFAVASVEAAKREVDRAVDIEALKKAKLGIVEASNLAGRAASDAYQFSDQEAKARKILLEAENISRAVDDKIKEANAASTGSMGSTGAGKAPATSANQPSTSSTTPSSAATSSAATTVPPASSAMGKQPAAVDQPSTTVPPAAGETEEQKQAREAMEAVKALVGMVKDDDMKKDDVLETAFRNALARAQQLAPENERVLRINMKNEDE